MAVREGFKKTDAGVVPNDWEVRQIGDFTPFVTSGSRGWAKFYAEFGDVFIRITNMFRSSIHLDLDDLKYVQLKSNDSEGKRTRLQVGDLLISITADIGIIGYVDEKVPSPAYINQHIALLRFQPAEIDTKYLAYFLAAKQSQDYFASLVDQGAKAGMNLRTVQQIPAAFPPLREQKAIAAALSDVDELVTNLETLIAKKQAIKQGAMQELLTGRKRMPGFEGEWEEKRLGDVLTVRHGRSQHAVAVSDGKYPIFATGGEIGRSREFLYDKPSVLIGRKGTIDQPRYAAEPFWTIDTLFYTEIYKGNDPLFLYFVFQRIDWRSFNEASGVPSLSASTIENIGVTTPALLEQQAIATVLSDMDAEITQLEDQLGKTRALKQAMMQELLTGRIRLPEEGQQNE